MADFLFLKLFLDLNENRLLYMVFTKQREIVLTERTMITALLTFRSRKQKWPQEQVYQSIVTSLLADLVICYSIVLNIEAFLTNYVNVNLELNSIALLPVAGF